MEGFCCLCVCLLFCICLFFLFGLLRVFCVVVVVWGALLIIRYYIILGGLFSFFLFFFLFFFLNVDSGNVVLVNCDDDVVNAIANGHNGHDDDVFVIVSDITLFTFLLSINIRYSAFSASSPPPSSFLHHVCHRVLRLCTFTV